MDGEPTLSIDRGARPGKRISGETLTRRGAADCGEYRRAARANPGACWSQRGACKAS
jgi:hypothetical protein